MPSGVGIIRWGSNGGVVVLSNVPATATAVASPFAAYGTIGLNDSGAYATGAGFGKWAFQIVGPGANVAGYTFSVYGTIDPAAYTAYTAAMRGGGSFQSLPEPFTAGVPTTSWSVVPGQASTGTGVDANPLVTGVNTFIIIGAPLVAIRVVLTAVAAPTQPVSVIGFAVP